MDKSPDAFRTISEVAAVLETPAHVLRFWESRFPQIRPVKRAGGRRYYRPSDVALLTGIKRLLHDEGLTIRGVQKILRDQGVRHVAGLSDDSVAVADLMSEATSLPVGDLARTEDLADAGGMALSVPGATAQSGVKQDAAPQPVVVDTPARPQAAQPPLPLFDAAPALRPLRDDITLAAMIRALPQGHSAPQRAAMLAVAGRLAALRATMAERADGGPG